MEIKSIEYNKSDDENTRQKKNEILVCREVYSCFSYGFDELLKGGLVSYEDIENLYLSDDQIKEYNSDIKTEEDLSDFRDNGNDTQEIYEYWIVSEWFYNKLKSIGEPVCEWGNLYIWGRTCTGQAICLDYTIDKIRKSMN